MHLVKTTGSISNDTTSGRFAAACTIISRNYLSHARILAASYLEHHPGARFYVLVIDGLPEGWDAGEDVCVIRSDELALPFFSELCFKYDVTELCTAVKPSLLSLLLNRYHEEQVVYLDPDILVTKRFEELIACLTTANIVLIPHLLKPIPQDGHRPNEQDILIAGAYNLGFIAVQNSETTREFLSWWQARLRDGCFVDVPQGLMTDQKWIDLVPGLFDATVFKDETYNVAYWNIHSRPLERSGDRFLVNGRPLSFFHFSGFDPANPKLFSKHQDRTRIVRGTALSDLLQLYTRLHIENHLASTRKWRYQYGYFDNGVKISVPLRRVYRRLQERERAGFGDPFRTEGEKSFLQWATTPLVLDRYSPFLRMVYELRPDVAAAYPDIIGKDKDRFLEWAYTSGAHEFGYDPVAMRVPCHTSRVLNQGGVEPAVANGSTKCSIIVPVHNNASLTRNCIDRVFATAPAGIDFEVIVTDDGSTDNTVDVLKAYGKQICIVPHIVNKGFSHSCNDAAAIANGEYLIFLNNDTIPEAGWLDKLVKYADAHPEAAVVGSKLLFPNDTIQHCGIAICEDGEPRHLYAGFPAEHELVNRSRKLKAVTGACLLIRRQDFQMVKGFDPAFHNGYEDVDLCLRLGELGRQVHYCHESVLYHLEAVSRDSKPGNEIANRKLFRSRWADRVQPDALLHYLADDLLTIEHTPFYPIRFSISPLLATISAQGRERQADRLLETRSRQVFGLLKDNIRLNVRAQEEKLRGQFVPENGHSRVREARPLGQPQVIHRGQIQWLSNQPTGRIISILLPVKNGASKLRKLLPAVLAQQTRDHVEIVAIDSGSTDESVELLKQFNATIISIDPRSFNHGLTRNLATMHANGSIFVFLNQTTLPADAHWLANLVRPFADDASLAGVCGRVLPHSDADLLTAREINTNINASTQRVVAEITDWKLYRSLQPHMLRAFVNFHTLSAAIRADVFRRIPFREADFAEDLIWGKEALEAGLRIQFEPSSVVFHSHNYSLLDVLRRNFDDGIACQKIVGITMSEDEAVRHMEEIGNIWRYLENECRLEGEELDLWRVRAAARWVATVIGQWLGLNFDRVNGDLASLLSITEQIKSGAKIEVSETGTGYARSAG